MELLVCFHGKESIHGLNSLILYEQPGDGQSVQQSSSLDSSSESWGPNGFDGVASVLGDRGGGPPTARVSRGDETGVLGGTSSDGPGATGFGNVATVNGHVAIDFPIYYDMIDYPSLEGHRQWLTGRKTKMMWFLRFVVDSVVRTCLENSVDLSNDAQFGKIFLVYSLMFTFEVAVSSIRAELLEDAPFKSGHVYELFVALLKFIYLVSFRVLHGMGVSSSTKYVKVYSVFKCVFSILIKLISALATLKSLNNKFNVVIHQD